MSIINTEALTGEELARKTSNYTILKGAMLGGFVQTVCSGVVLGLALALPIYYGSTQLANKKTGMSIKLSRALLPGAVGVISGGAIADAFGLKDAISFDFNSKAESAYVQPAELQHEPIDMTTITVPSLKA